MDNINMTLVKHCEHIDFHDPHEVRYADPEDFGFLGEQEEDFSCPGITSVADRVAALERRAADYGKLQQELHTTQDRLKKTEAIAEYHRTRHGKAAQALQMATTSPDTKAAYEQGYARGQERGQARAPYDASSMERAIDHALLPALQHCARLEQEVARANQALNAAYVKIDALFHPAPVVDEEEDGE
jgi:flagellar biosynthesis/type III secretory pathway protein FliH